MVSRFSVRFVIAVFGGAAVGLLVGVVARYVVGADWNVFAVMSWGIMAGAVALGLSHLQAEQKRTGRPKGR